MPTKKKKPVDAEAKITEENVDSVAENEEADEPSIVENNEEEVKVEKVKRKPVLVRDENAGLNSGVTERNDPYTQRKQATKELLAKEAKIAMFIPLLPGEKDGASLELGLNGYVVYVKKGVMVDLPESLAELVKDHLVATSQAGRRFELGYKVFDSEAEAKEALNY